jgi:CrcB protein
MIAAVAVGEAIGAILGLWASLSVGASLFGVAGPSAALLVNVVGLGLMGCLAGAIAASMILPEAWRGFFAISLLGAADHFFSSFELAADQLWQKQSMVKAGAYVMASVLLSLLAIGAGFWAVRHGGIWQ